MSKAQPAPAPWDFTASGKPGSNGDLNIYITDKTGRKIAAVWGKREEKELTACLMISAPDLLSAVKEAAEALEGHMPFLKKEYGKNSDELKAYQARLQSYLAVIAQAEGLT